MKRVWKFYFGIGVSLVILFALFRDIPFSEVLSYIRELNPVYLLLAFFLYFLDFFIPAIRFHFIGKKNGIHISFRSSYAAVFIGALGNYIFPARAGEVVKTLYLQKANPQDHFGRTKAFGMLLWERTLDFLIIFFLLISMLNYFNVIGENSSSLFPLIIICSGLFFVLFFLMTGRRLMLKIINITNLKKGKVRQYAEYLFDIFEDYRNVLFIVTQCIISGLYWSIVMFGYFLVFQSAGITLSLAETLLFLSIGTMGIAIPAGPGSIGVIQGAFVLAGNIVGIHSEMSLALGIAYQSIQALFILIMGTIVALASGISRGRIYES